MGKKNTANEIDIQTVNGKQMLGVWNESKQCWVYNSHKGLLFQGLMKTPKPNTK